MAGDDGKWSTGCDRLEIVDFVGVESGGNRSGSCFSYASYSQRTRRDVALQRQRNKVTPIIGQRRNELDRVSYVSRGFWFLTKIFKEGTDETLSRIRGCAKITIDRKHFDLVSEITLLCDVRATFYSALIHARRSRKIEADGKNADCVSIR